MGTGADWRDRGILTEVIMDIAIYELTFQTGVHFGDGSLADNPYTFSADTLFSALYAEALRVGRDCAEKLLNAVRTEKLAWSDAMPRMQGTRYLPKPYVQVAGKKERAGDSSIKKAMKNMLYVPADLLDDYLHGDLPLERTDDLERLGRNEIRSATAIRGQDNPLPYGIGVFTFQEGCGLDLIVSSEGQENEAMFEKLLSALSGSGIGGKRSSGLGRFSFHKAEADERLKSRMRNAEDVNMSLSVCLPEEDELQSALDGAHYLVRKRSGFVASEHYSPELHRKKDLYVFAAGSCFAHRFHGQIADVSNGGAHPVYRYAKPLWLGVNV